MEDRLFKGWQKTQRNQMILLKKPDFYVFYLLKYNTENWFFSDINYNSNLPHDSSAYPNHATKRQSGSFESMFLRTIYYRCGRKPQPSMKTKTCLIIILSIHVKI